MRAVLIASVCIAAAISLGGCAVYEVASTAVDITTTVVGVGVDVAGDAVDVAGDVITAPFPSRESDKKNKSD
jgi:hypothetical protein